MLGMLQPSFGDFFRPPEATAPGSLPEPTWNAADASATISQSPNPPAQSHPKTHQWRVEMMKWTRLIRNYTIKLSDIIMDDNLMDDNLMDDN